MERPPRHQAPLARFADSGGVVIDSTDPHRDAYFLPARVYETPAGTKYLREAGVALLSRPRVNLRAAQDFLHGMGDADYLRDDPVRPDGSLGHPDASSHGAADLLKFAGQMCYLSLGPDRTRNADAGRYFRHVKESGHGSLLEHANYTVLLHGVSRAFTHELVRHRAGFGFSQVSQRYVPPRRLRFVMAREYQGDGREAERARFEAWIDRSREEYLAREELALVREHPHAWGSTVGDLKNVASLGPVCVMCGGPRPTHAGPTEPCPASLRAAGTDARKRVRQSARRCLPNEAEAPVVVTGNLRAWRNAVEQRCAWVEKPSARGKSRVECPMCRGRGRVWGGVAGAECPEPCPASCVDGQQPVERVGLADVEIRCALYRVFLVLSAAEPLLWEDYTVTELDDGTRGVATPYKKV